MMNTQIPVSNDIQLGTVYLVSQVFARANTWKPALDTVLKHIRPSFIFDNMVVFLNDPKTGVPEVSYAKATGRGHNAEAEVSWGELIATQVLQTRKTVLQEPPNQPDLPRLERPFTLGIPLLVGADNLGSIIFIRFGSPPFTPADVQFAEFIAQNLALLIEAEAKEEELNTVDALRTTLRAQGDFLATLSHEIRSPLGFIKGYTTTLLRSDANWDTNTQKEFLRIIDQETDRMEKLLENLLDSAQWESGRARVDLQPIRLEPLLNDLVIRSRVHHAQLNISVEIDGTLPIIEGDPRRLTQVFDNLVVNAVKYAPGSPLMVVAEKKPDAVEIYFIDNGSGISPEALPFVFDRFYRGPDQARSADGSGLGLFICRQIILAHNGDITISSTPGEGTTLKISLPLPKHNQARE